MGYKNRGRTYDEFSIGEEIYTASRTVTEADIVNFAGLSGDFNPLHTDEELMKKSAFGGRIAHGVLILAICTGLQNQLGTFEGTTIAVMQLNNQFVRPVKPGDTLKAIIKCTEKKDSRKQDRGIATFMVTVTNQNGEVVLESEQIIMLKRRQE